MLTDVLKINQDSRQQRAAAKPPSSGSAHSQSSWDHCIRQARLPSPLLRLTGKHLTALRGVSSASVHRNLLFSAEGLLRRNKAQSVVGFVRGLSHSLGRESYALVFGEQGCLSSESV